MTAIRVLLLSLATTSLALASSQTVWAHPSEAHTDTATASEPATAPEHVDEAVLDASLHESAAPHAHDEAMPHQEGAAPVEAHHDEAAPHEHAAAAEAGHHDEAAPHEHGAAAEAGNHDEAAPNEHGAGTEGDDHGEAGHSHWGENGANTPFEKAMERLGVFHSLVVHFPIALILAAALAQALNLAGMRVSNADTVRFLVWTGALGGLAAGLLGWAHSGPMASNEAGVMLAHRWIGSSLALGLFALVAAVEWHRKNPTRLSGLVMNLSLFAAAAAVAINGFLGGSLAHGGMNHLMGM